MKAYLQGQICEKLFKKGQKNKKFGLWLLARGLLLCNVVGDPWSSTSGSLAMARHLLDYYIHLPKSEIPKAEIVNSCFRKFLDNS